MNNKTKLQTQGNVQSGEHSFLSLASSMCYDWDKPNEIYFDLATIIKAAM